MFHRFTCVISFFGDGFGRLFCFLVCLVCVCVFCLVAVFGLLPPRVRSFISFDLCANSMQS